MKLPISIQLGALLLAASCASTAGGDHLDALGPVGATSRTSLAAVTPGRTSTIVRSDDATLELRIWNSAAFKRRFAESYLARTDVEPEFDDTTRERVQQVMELVASEQLGEAAVLIDKWNGAKANAVFDYMRASIALQQDQLEQAASSLERAVEKFPNFVRAWQNLGMAYVRLERHADAIRPLTRVIEAGAGNGLTFGLLGFCYANVGNTISAESSLRMAVLLDPDTDDWKMQLARVLFEQKRYPDAVALTEVLIRQEPANAEFWRLQATAYSLMDEPLRAAENFEMVDRLGGATPDSLNNLADLYARQELFDAAVDTYLRAMELAPDAKPERALRAAKVLARGGINDEARRLVDVIETRYGGTLEAQERGELLKLRARIAVAEGAGDEEVRALEAVVALDPLDGDGLILLGSHHAREGHAAEAINYFERAANIEAFEARAKLNHAQLLVRDGKYHQALPLLRRAQDLEPKEHVQQFLEQIERLAKK